MRISAILLSAAFTVATFMALPAYAQSEPVILTIDGAIEGGKPVDFTMSQLEALGTATIVTSTPWTEGTPTFDGVPMRVLLEHVGAKGETAEVLALNNYQTSVPVIDFTTYPVILATKMDGEYMTVRNKGPLFIMYPFDAVPELQAEIYLSRAAWQVRTITIK
ncbi:molybdopterin-dependent oxidoreductase [Devosia limi]|uniref:Oxidoreductase molybdopterin-binding domain-containing protein n=2 Tax=Devosia limi DSM 17137 TaxID=1121477 RepID=A0A1M4YB31_9HYPH|nr:molybdopterin-dependent oxidoreductase [Devosia limi]SHF02692.1 hypothetical protein SAMN02745223_01609 [Devosia limi DSM 17137]